MAMATVVASRMRERTHWGQRTLSNAVVCGANVEFENSTLIGSIRNARVMDQDFKNNISHRTSIKFDREVC
jgi:hypothetical protein